MSVVTSSLRTMIEAPESPALTPWRDVAFKATGHHPTEELQVYTDGDNECHERLLISREPAMHMVHAAPDGLNLLIVSLSKRTNKTGDRVKPSDAKLLEHISTLLGEAYAAASFPQPALSRDGFSTYRLIFVDGDQQPVLAVEGSH